MAGGDTLLTLVSDLGSSKITNRQTGLSTLRTVLASDSALDRIDRSEDPRKTWRVLFQALFETVLKEREAAASQKPGAALRRLAEAASTVRWVTERSVQRLNAKCTKTLLAHLRQTIIHNGTLYAPVALDYVKAIRRVMTWAPHLEHISAAVWVALVEMGFNVVLGDPARKKLSEVGDGPEADDEEGSVAFGTAFGSPAQDEEDDDGDNTGTPSTTATTARKRRHQSPLRKPQLNTPSARSAPKHSKPISLEQIEFMSLLVTLLQFPSAPLLDPEYRYLPASILNRLQRFLTTYPVDSSLHHDFLLMVSSVLSCLALNHVNLVKKFARDVWDGLVAMWGTKNQRVKEDLVVVLRALFPYLTAESEDDGRFAAADYRSGVSKLWSLLNGEAESRWGMNGLALDAIRLHSLEPERSEVVCGAFIAKTFRYGWHFDASQALAWAVLELQADCAVKLYRLSESIHVPEPTSSKAAGKRRKSEDPITNLLYLVKTQSTANIRAYHLQSLLFFVDRHWSILHDSLQRDVISTLMQYVSFDDGAIQSWTFLCLAAIAHSSATALPRPGPTPQMSENQIWDPIWTHAMRRSNVPAVSRAACHTAYILLIHARRLLTSQRVLAEIEAFAKDLDIQGPTFPYDSVCAFLILCLRVANQDVRLYRLQLEEKALTWLTDAWRERSGSRLKMPLHTAGDVLMLLESICALSRRSDLFCAASLPECQIVGSLIDEHETTVIRDFLLHATLPPFRSSASGYARSPTSSLDVISSTTNSDAHDLTQPRGRERRISAFLLKSMEDLSAGWESNKDVTGYMTAEKLRSSLDFSVTSLFLEAALVVNGTRPNRRTIQAACRLVKFVAPLVTNSRWTAEERALILSGLQPLIMADSREQVSGWETFLSPNESTGIRQQILRSLTAASTSSTRQLRTERRTLQRVVFQSVDVQDAFSSFMDSLRDVLRITIGDRARGNNVSNAMEVDEKDGFGPVRSSRGVGLSVMSQRDVSDTAANRNIVDICMTLLALVPILQSASGEPTRDKELIDLVQNCDAEHFLFVAPAFLDNIRQRTLNLSPSSLDPFLQKLSDLLSSHAYSRSEPMRLLAIRFLDSTSHVWLREDAAISEAGDHVRELCFSLSEMLRKDIFHSWRIRDHLTRFLDNYLAQDPKQVFWMADGDCKPEDLPSSLLPTVGADKDIRVRFRAAVTNARMFFQTSAIGQTPLGLYQGVREYLTTELDEYERMLTRLLCLANIMVASSAVRRGPYWHLLETCLHTTVYSRHIETVLTEVGARMGLSKFSDLFESYASQLAYSIRQGEQDFLRFPPHLLGYRDRKDCAVTMFRAFTPTNLLAGGPPESIRHGQQLFVNHCKAIQISPAEGIRQCFPEIVGYQIVFWLDANQDRTDVPSNKLEALLRVKTSALDDDQFATSMAQSADAIVIAILRTLRDQDLSTDGPISHALREVAGDNAATVFQKMTRHRLSSRFKSHEPNLPTYGSTTVLRALNWLKTRIPDADTNAITYHILHQLFADIECSPIVNEQMRLLNAISLWVASHDTHFEDYTLLRTIMNGATTILAQSDLAYAAQGLLDWGFNLYSKCTEKEKDTRLPDTLIRISRLAYDYAEDRYDLSVASMGRDLMDWIEDRTMDLCTHPRLKDQVVKALSAWPRDLPPALRSLCERVRSHELSEILNDHRISASKFRLVRRLRDLAVDKSCVDGQFMRSDFWRLKECIPPSTQLLNDDVDAFSTLLLLNQGLVGGFGSEQLVTQGVRTRHRDNFRDKHSAQSNKAHRPIVEALLAMLHASSSSQTHLAYLTLRSLSSVYSSHTLPQEYVTEMQYLRAHPISFTGAQSCSLHEQLASDAMLELSTNFARWIPHLTILLCNTLAIEDEFYVPLEPMLRSDPIFAEQVLPILVHTLLQLEISSAKDHNPRPSREALSTYFTSILQSDSSSESCLRVIVDIVLHLRSFTPPGERGRDLLAHEKWLDVDHTLLSQSAIRCGAYTTALLFLELAAEYHEASSTDTATTEQVLFDIYSHIDEPDGFYGIKTQDLHRFLIRRLHHEQQWDKAFRFHGAALEAGTSDTADSDGIVQALHSFGFDKLAMNTMTRAPSNTDDGASFSAMTYQLGWRTETWDLPEHMDRRASGASLYLALRAIYRERNQIVSEGIIRDAMNEEMRQLRGLGDENLTEIRQVVQNLMCLRQITQWRSHSVSTGSQYKSADSYEPLGFTELDPNFDFSDAEAIMATRVSLVRSVRQKEQREQIGNLLSPLCRGLVDLETRCLVRLSEAARHANQAQVALNSVTNAQRLSPGASPEVSHEFAHVLWLMKESKLAVQSLMNLLSTIERNVSTDNIKERTKDALLLARLGTWSAEASMGKAEEVMSRCFTPASNLLLECKPDSLQAYDSKYAAVYHQYAIFAERQYHSIVNSPDALRWRVYVDRKTEEIKQRTANIPLGEEERKKNAAALNKATKLLKQDIEHSTHHIRSRNSFLTVAIDMYSRCLEASDLFDDDAPIRLCSLWLANFDDSDANLDFGVALARVPSHKFVFLAHQLAARLSRSQSPRPTANQDHLQTLITRMCGEHPFHSLYQVYCLIGDHGTSQATSSTRRLSQRLETMSSQADRAAAAGTIFDRLRSISACAKRVQDIETVCQASLEWAKYPIKGSKPSKTPLPVPSKLMISRIQNLRVPIITVHTPLDPTTRYQNCVCIKRYDTVYTTAGGINLPKITFCFGDDGLKYKQLFKGEGDDDLRQDAVMEQVFDLVNVVLRHDRETQRRKLSVRGYRVVPLSSQAGVLEFVENTMPLGNWLTAAHPRYRPDDLRHSQVQEQLAAKHHECKHAPEPLGQLLLQIRTRFKPVMRHYFTESHKTPMSWFAMRLNYARSVATTSIVGHILGLGDRHTSNILMDNGTGEVVHIDLGIAFEQGKLLPVPERVPFRLTADMVDGLGITGTQGVFHRCAEETLRVLRDRSEIILTVLEVFKYDPLHSWTASELKVKRVQGSSVEKGEKGGKGGKGEKTDQVEKAENVANARLTEDAFRRAIGIDMASGTADEAADRALQSVNRKLDKTFSVEYTVNELIAEATDLGNLAAMFHGWGPQY